MRTLKSFQTYVLSIDYTTPMDLKLNQLQVKNPSYRLWLQGVLVESGRTRQTIITCNDEVLTIQSTRFLFDNQICFSIKTDFFPPLETT